MKLNEVKFGDLSDITYRMFLHEYPIPVSGRSGVELFVIEFAGKHRIGSEGNNDSLYMATIIKAAMNIWYVDGLVLDFKDLNYEWGNSIGEVILAGKSVFGKTFPTAVVVSELCEPALKSAQPFYAVDSQSGGQVKWLFDDFESAASFVKEQVDISAHLSGSKQKSI